MPPTQLIFFVLVKSVLYEILSLFKILKIWKEKKSTLVQSENTFFLATAFETVYCFLKIEGGKTATVGEEVWMFGIMAKKGG